MNEHLRKLKTEAYNKYINEDDIESLEDLLKCDDDVPTDAICVAVRKGNLLITKMILEYSQRTPIMKYAIYSGIVIYEAILTQNEDIIKLVKQYRIHDDMDSAKAIVQLPYEKVIEYTEKEYVNKYDLMCYSIECNRKDIVEYLISHKITLDENYFRIAINTNNLEIAQLLIDNGCSKGSSCYNIAIMRYDTNLIKWLHERDCAYNETTLIVACRYGTLEIVRYFHELGFDMNFNIGKYYVSKEILEYLHKHRLSIYRECIKDCTLCRTERIEVLNDVYKLINEDY